MYESLTAVLRDALPGCLGSLIAALILAAGTWIARKLRTRLVPPAPSSEVADSTATPSVRPLE
ncbi:hypothetical protein [Streptomyces sp. CA-132043]|uniref:hypothetical protein n=1 Tax=Streptomyces sp. CA-132043 TaxID=3240048 RepID=UPI003D8EBD17